MSKTNGLPDCVNYFYGPEVAEPLRHDLFRRPAEDYTSLAELEMVAGCAGCHDSDDQSTLIVAHDEQPFHTGGFVSKPVSILPSDRIAATTVINSGHISFEGDSGLIIPEGKVLKIGDFEFRGPIKMSRYVAEAPEDLDQVMNQIPREPALVRRIVAGILVFWLAAVILAVHLVLS